jgi:hypothetical protein
VLVADCPHGLGGPSVRLRRTICRYGGDHLKRALEPIVANPINQTIRNLPADRLPHKDYLHPPRRPSTKHLATKNPRLNGSKHELPRTQKEHDKHPVSRLLADRP